MNRFLLSAFALILAISSSSQAPRTYSSSEIFLQLKRLETTGSVLYIAAHPDDENTRLIAYLANDLCLTTNYLSLTRGDGGQNLIGKETGINLGIIRTQELLAARRVDGAGQYFTRAYDFGFSKNPEETFSKWGHDAILEDVVWVIRLLQPDVIITRFATDGSGGHGHHTASAIVAEEAFDAAADSTRFPEQLKLVKPWQTERLFWNVSSRFNNPNADMSAYIALNVGGFNRLKGESYGEIAAESRSMHKSQGFGSARQRGEYFEYFKPIKGDTANLKDIFQGLNFSYSEFENGNEVSKLIRQIQSDFNFQNPAASLPRLLELKSIMHRHNEGIFRQKESLLDEIIFACAGLVMDVTAREPQAALNDSLQLDITLINRSDARIVINSIEHKAEAMSFKKLETLNKSLPEDIVQTISTSAIPRQTNEQKHWLANPVQNDLFQVEDFFGRQLPEKPAPYNLDISFSINNIPFTVKRPIQYRWTDAEKGELYRPLVITPPVMLNMADEVVVFSDNQAKEIKVLVRAGKDKVSGKLMLRADKGWKISPAEIAFELDKRGEEKLLSFQITPPSQNSNSTLSAVATVSGKEYTRGFYEIRYDHIPIQTSFPKATSKLVKLDIIKKSNRIGYIEGAGDDVAVCLRQIGYSVDVLQETEISAADLSSYDAIVLGIRAFNVHENLYHHLPKLMNYVKDGGNLIVQYNTNNWSGPIKGDIAPYPFTITRDRVTDENATVHFELPNHPVLNTPNKITSRDFDGWIQERCIYSAGDLDSHYETPLSWADPGEKPIHGSLITAKYGKGNYIYSGIVFFRELPAGVPGAYRLFVNLIELGK